ncbi:MAG: prepilin-type N-terminal cleavage/methylation domain-containing protein [Bacilli bacterium]|nr:prepilin-type N-terminal cleavage/methylation domain-containing protein [Bacilli bacterium]
MRKGFTLVELLGVLVLIAMISLLVAPKITELFEKKQEEASDATKEILYAAAREYISSNQSLFNTGNSYYCITLNDLVNDGQLVNPVIDITSGSHLSLTTNIEVTIENSQYHFEYNTVRCQ